MDYSIPLNKFAKEKRVIELHQHGKTIRQIAPEVHMSFRDISKIIKAYDKKIGLQQSKKEENNQSSKIKKLSLSSQAFKLFKEGKKPTDIAIILDIQYPKVSKFWYQFLKLEKKFDCYEFYEVWQYDLPSLLSISNFMKRNDVSGTDILNVLRIANDVINLNQTYLNLKTETKYLEQKRMYLLDYSRSPYSLQPLPLNKPNYNYYGY